MRGNNDHEEQMKAHFAGAAAIAALLAAGSAGAATITKTPDLGNYWHELVPSTSSPSSGSYVYTDSFIAPVSGTVSDLGTWLLNGSASLVFEILADSAGKPNGGSILAQTATLSYFNSTLTYEHAAPVSSASLVAGQRYWFAASTIGLGGSGGYTVGGHTQNSAGITDDGTFWFSNDGAGLAFTGPNTPEMAFSVTVGAPLPEPSTGAIMAAVLPGLFLVRRRQPRRGG